MNPSATLADLIVVAHAAYVAFVVFGVPVVFFGAWRGWRFVRNFWFRAIHLFMIGFVALESLTGIACPLTIWERRLRLEAGQPIEQGSFVARMAHRLIFVDFPPHVLTIAYVVFAVVVIVMFIAIPPRRPWPLARR